MSLTERIASLETLAKSNPLEALSLYSEIIAELEHAQMKLATMISLQAKC
jgi:hypothetical protein